MKHTTIIEGLINLCAAPDGATRDEINSYLAARSTDPSQWWRILLRRRAHTGYQWTIDERGGHIILHLTQ